MKSGRRAVSLVEALVALAVFGLITSLIAGVFVLSHRYTRVFQQVSRVQREAAHCMQAFQAELTRGHSQTYQPVPAVNETWFLSSRPLEGQPGLGEFADNGQLLWQKWVGIWRQPDGLVWRSELPLSGGARPFLLVDLDDQPSSLMAFSTLSSRRRLASAVRRFQVSVDSRIVTVELESETSNSGNPSTRYHMTSSFLVP
ncbi:MAG: type II secretion system protein [Candidatus Eremiobacteraeota bacterium]|nr:type II secretion system protein [Candidatus Eremiobacteraeota bacterium]MCW5869644.1 type II secretion system protein [Candidatus Eremiobacteraeota bacterium]